MNLYLVRHGPTAANREHCRHLPDELKDTPGDLTFGSET
jgi:hypothetical protein